MTDTPTRANTIPEYYIDPATGQKYLVSKLSGVEASDGSGADAINVYISDAFANERNTGTANQYGVGVDECTITHIAASQTDVAVSGGDPALIFGIVFDAAQTGTVTVKDNATTVSSVAVAATQSPSIDFKGAKLVTSLVVTTAASAACAILWRKQS